MKALLIGLILMALSAAAPADNAVVIGAKSTEGSMSIAWMWQRNGAFELALVSVEGDSLVLFERTTGSMDNVGSSVSFSWDEETQTFSTDKGSISSETGVFAMRMTDSQGQAWYSIAEFNPDQQDVFEVIDHPYYGPAFLFRYPGSPVNVDVPYFAINAVGIVDLSQRGAGR